MDGVGGGGGGEWTHMQRWAEGQMEVETFKGPMICRIHINGVL